MIKAVLLDLDNTLLGNENAIFVPQYFRLADQYFLEEWAQPGMSRALSQVVAALSRSRDNRQPNLDLAETIIAETMQRPLDEVRRAFATFYSQVYPQLQRYVQPIPFAQELFQYLRQHDYAVVIATNPLYPAEAIYQRLAWAGLPSDPAEYAFVTTADNTHFIKPEPAYYAEIIARVGVEPDETLMVGDSLENDIYPANCLGIITYHVSASPQNDHGGTLEDFYRQISETDWLRRIEPKALLPDSIRPQLLGNLAALYGLLAQVKPQQWDQHPDPKEWSIMEVVCHLLASERQVQRPRLERILNEDNPFLIPPQSPPGPDQSPPCADEGLQAADDFFTERLQTIAWLDQLPAEAWRRPARHSIFGLTTLLEMAHFTAQHDRLHINQICETLGRCH